MLGGLRVPTLFSGRANWCILTSSSRGKRHAKKPSIFDINAIPNGGKQMKTYLATALAGAAFVGFTGMAIAHHSFAMFDQEHPQEVTGIVKDFKYTSPHSFIILDIKDKEGNAEAWNLEGGSPSALARDGWTSKSLKTGDELRLTIEPLRSGAPGGAWNVNRIKFMDGKPIVPKTQ
jgi:hypothetical protein